MLSPSVEAPRGAQSRPIVIIGAGITGVTTAYSLLKQGHTVTVIDRHLYPAMETSYANGGQLSASNAEVWNSWNTIMKGVRWMLRPDAPLLLNPRFSFHKYSWLAEFCSLIGQHRTNTIETARLALTARRHLFAIAEREGIQFDLEKRGILHLYHDKPSFEAAARSNALLLEAGLERAAVSPNEMLAIEPTLHGQFYGGFYTPGDASGDIHKFTRGLARTCVRLGARFLLGAKVTSIDVETRRMSSGSSSGYRLGLVNAETADPVESVTAGVVVVCAGVASRTFAAHFGDRLNIYPVKGYSVTVSLTDAESQQAAPTVSLLDDAAKIVTSRLGRERFRVAGTAELNGFNWDIRADRISPLLHWCRKLFPQMSTSAVIPWAGLRPMTPSMMPRVGRGRRPGIYYNTGHGHLGWTLSAATAAMIAETITEDLDPPAGRIAY